MIDEARLLECSSLSRTIATPTRLPSDKSCLVCVRFFFADSSITQQALKMVVGPVQHVEIIVIDKENPAMCIFSFAAFVGEPLSMYITPKDSLMNTSIENIVLPISQSVATALSAYYLNMHTCKIPYNWYDSRVLMPFWSPYTLGVIDDVDHTHVFCSQMVVLGLRECMNVADDNQLIHELKRLNSRLTSPHTLLNILRGFGRPMDSVELIAYVQEGFEASNRNSFSA
jgi:hypothetical protein